MGPPSADLLRPLNTDLRTHSNTSVLLVVLIVLEVVVSVVVVLVLPFMCEIDDTCAISTTHKIDYSSSTKIHRMIILILFKVTTTASISISTSTNHPLSPRQSSSRARYI